MRKFERFAAINVGLIGILVAAVAAAEDWPRFRGPDGSGVSRAADLPQSWSNQQNLRWNFQTPGPGSSSPIVVGDRVLITCYTGYGIKESDSKEKQRVEDLERHLLCLSLNDGAVIWQRSMKSQATEDPFQGFLDEHGYASSTPVTDGRRVFVFFGKSGVIAFDLEGQSLWQVQLGTGSGLRGWGSAASPLLYKDLLIVNADAESESLVALNAESGKEIWRTETKGYKGSWSTPILVDTKDGGKELVVAMPGEIWGLDPSDGGLLWFCETGMRPPTNPSVVADSGIVYFLSGGAAGSAVLAVRAGGRDDVTQTHVLWRKPLGSYVPSPLVLDGYLYWVNERGLAHCLKAETGDEVYRERLPGAAGVYASLTAGDGKLFAVTRRNGTFVLATGPKFEVLATNTFEGDTSDFNASPAIAEGCLILRSNRFVYCVGE